MTESSTKQYAAAANLPLIKSPSLRTPRPVELPPDIHPLPEDITVYFVYPFTLEPHVLTLESSRQSTLLSHAARSAAYLRSREEDKARRKREALRKIAPGFEPMGGTLVPTKVGTPRDTTAGSGTVSIPIPSNSVNVAGRSVMDDLVDQLAALDSAASPR